MSARKRIWTTREGEIKEAWIVVYRDKTRGGARRTRTFRLKKEAEDFAVTAKSEVRDGIHIGRSKSVTIAQAGKFWIDTAEANGLEQGTIVDYQRAVRLQIGPISARSSCRTSTRRWCARSRMNCAKQGGPPSW